MSLFDVEKYPPSLEYLFVTFGVLLLLYVALDVLSETGRLPRLRHFVQTYGRVPFFYYVLHIYLIHAAALVTSLALGDNWKFWIGTGFLRGVPLGWGFSLPVVYAIWACVVLALYRPCLWFSRVKARRRDWWLSYI